MNTCHYAAVLVIGIITECAFLNEPLDFRTTVCRGDTLSGQCNKNQKMIVSSLKAGFKGNNACNNQSISNRKDCCKLEAKRDCLEPINDPTTYRSCTGKSVCRTTPTLSKSLHCRNASYPVGKPSFYSIRYLCIENSRFGDCSSSVLKSCSKGQILYLMSPGYPNNVSSPINCACSISSDCNTSINVTAVDIQISRTEHMIYNDTISSLYDTDRDNKYIISDQFTSKTRNILFNAKLVNGRFLVAVKAGCIQTIRCPRGLQTKPSNCDNTTDNDFPWWWIAIAIAVIFSAGAFFVCRYYKKKKDSKVSRGKLSTTRISLCTTLSNDKDDYDISICMKNKSDYNDDGRSVFGAFGKGECRNVPPLIRTIHVNTHRLPPISRDKLSEKEEGSLTERKKSKRRKKKHRVDPEVERVEKTSDKSAIEETLEFFTSDIINMTNNTNSTPENFTKG